MQSQLETMFERMGARVRVRETFSGNRGGIDIRSDRHGEYFDIGVGVTERVEYEVIDIQPRLRHLLLHIPEQSLAVGRADSAVLQQQA